MCGQLQIRASRINSVENQADHVFDRAVADLFLYETDAIRLIKYKEILSSLKQQPICAKMQQMLWNQF